MICKSDHRHADRLVEELQSGSKQSDVKWRNAIVRSQRGDRPFGWCGPMGASAS